ncbi:hypothetical protein KE540_01240 [Lachnospiraceae bacterium Marseille-Q4251]|nr:hypothetical protein [Lachnospiraceae bacterium Marseille-Q4251]
MTEIQKKMMEKLGLAESDFEKKETVVSNEERINDLEIAVCELLEAFGNVE